MTVEQALAARELLAQQAQNQLAKMEHINATDPDAVDPAVLAEQIALAERAAVLNRRAAAKQKLAEQNTKPEPARNDPTTANNLAMVTPLEFVQVPGMERPVMKRPATTYVPVVTNPGPRVEPSRKSGNRRPAPSRQRTASDASRGGVLARAEAAAKAASAPQATSRPAAADPADARSEEDFTGRTPVAANSAYGLDPLDAATAGLGRARRLRLIQLVVLALGLMALIAGITLIITGLSG
jgi:ribosomal protein L17